MRAVFCDWGTSNLRAWLLDDGQIVGQSTNGKGLMAAKEVGFQRVLDEVLALLNASGVPVYMSGMECSDDDVRGAVAHSECSRTS